VFLEQLQNVDEVRTRDRVTTDTHARGLTETIISSLLNSFIGQGTGAGHNTYFTWLVDVTRHNTDLTFTGSDNTGAVRTNQTHTQLVAFYFSVQHIQCRNTFSNTNDQLDATVCRFQDRILTERCRYIDNRGFCACRFYRFFNSIEYWQAEVSLTTFARRNTANHLGAVSNSLFRVEGALRTGKTLTNNFSVFVNLNAHDFPLGPYALAAAATPFWAAPVKSVSAMMFKPLSVSTFAPSSALLPCRRTTTGTFTPTSLTAPITPSAIMSQRTMPPKMLMNTALTLSSDRIILNASTTRSLVAPPPTSRKLAGWPPCSLTMSIVPIARPAPLTMQPMLPSNAT